MRFDDAYITAVLLSGRRRNSVKPVFCFVLDREVTQQFVESPIIVKSVSTAKLGTFYPLPAPLLDVSVRLVLFNHSTLLLRFLATVGYRIDPEYLSSVSSRRPSSRSWSLTQYATRSAPPSRFPPPPHPHLTYLYTF